MLDRRDAFDNRSAMIQYAVTFSGCVFLLCLALFFLGQEATTNFTATFSDIVMGTAAPLTNAQELMNSGVTFAEHNSFPRIFGLIAIKFAVINLLPLIGTNGFAAIGILLRSLGVQKEVSQGELKALYCLSLLVIGPWCVALAYFAWRLI